MGIFPRPARKSPTLGLGEFMTRAAGLASVRRSPWSESRPSCRPFGAWPFRPGRPDRPIGPRPAAPVFQARRVELRLLCHLDGHLVLPESAGLMPDPRRLTPARGETERRCILGRREELPSASRGVRPAADRGGVCGDTCVRTGVRRTCRPSWRSRQRAGESPRAFVCGRPRVARYRCNAFDRFACNDL